MRFLGLGLAFLCACGGLLAPDDEAPRADAGGDAGPVPVSPPPKEPSDAAASVDAAEEPPRGCPGDTSEPAVLLTERLISDFAVDQDWVYWSTLDGAVKRIPRCGGATTELTSQGAWGRNRLGLNSTHVFWTNDSRILRAPKAGGTIEDLTSNLGLGFVVDDASLYAFDVGGLRKYPLDGSAGVTLCAVSTDTLYQQRQRNIAETDSDVYVTSTEGSVSKTTVKVLQVPKGGAAPESVASESSWTGPTALAVDESNAYLANRDYTAVHLLRAPLDGSPSETLVAAAADFWVDSVRADATYVYWVGQISTKMSLRRVAKSGGSPETMLVKDYAPGDAGESLLALDDVYVYVSLGDGVLYRIRK